MVIGICRIAEISMMDLIIIIGSIAGWVLFILFIIGVLEWIDQQGRGDNE